MDNIFLKIDCSGYKKQVVLPKETALIIRMILDSAKEDTKEAYEQGKKDGANLLAQLRDGNISSFDFDQQTKY